MILDSPLGCKPHDLGFAPGELCARRAGIATQRAAGTQQPLGHGRLTHRGSSGHGTNRGERLCITTSRGVTTS